MRPAQHLSDRPSDPPAGVPSNDAVGQLRLALRNAPGTQTFNTELRAAIQALCDDAHAMGIPVEKLMIQFKQMWRTLPEARRSLDGRPDPALLERIISLCIEEYYAWARYDGH